MKHFISTHEHSRADLERILAMARTKLPRVLEGKSVGLVFFNPSLRTRVSFEVGIAQLGGQAVSMSVGSESWSLEFREGAVMDGDKTEHVKDAAQVLSRYVDAIAVRCFPGMKSYEEDMADGMIEAFRKYSDVPVINLESSLWHPCQAMADLLTIRERGAKKVSLVWAYHPKPLPMAVPNSFAVICAQFGLDLTIAWPKEFPLEDRIVKMLGNAKIVHDPQEAMAGAEIVYAKSWGGSKYYGRWDEEKKIRDGYRHWQVTRVPEGATFLHCLPVRRNVEVADAVLDASAIYDEAENRLHVQKAILAEILG
jgi:N-acetylornithine carbamoyltransferase